MDSICRLCCTTRYVNNYIFDEENALYLKMSLYMPIKVFKNDRLPQHICDKCSCRVNDFYQFCNESIEVQNRLRATLISSGIEAEDSIDLTLIKDNIDSPLVPALPIERCDRSTQTDTHVNIWDCENKLKVKVECKSPVPEVKSENDYLSYEHANIPSDDSDELSLIALKKEKEPSKKQKTKTKKSPRTYGNKENKKDSKKLKKKNALNWVTLDYSDDSLLKERGKSTYLDVVVKSENGDDDDDDDYGVIQTKKNKKNNTPEETAPKEYMCCICFSKQNTESEMKSHYRGHFKQATQGVQFEPPPPPPLPLKPPYKCLRCHKSVEASAWAGHWRRHWRYDWRPLRCGLCEKTFRDYSQIFKHGLTHGAGGEGGAPCPVKRFVCDLCPERFAFMRCMLAHRQAHPDAVSRPVALRCAVCDKPFAHLNSLNRHMLGHGSDRSFLCNVCGKRLSSREHLKYHIRIHTGFKPHACATCGKAFSKKCNLTLHERVHSGEKPHVCAHCGKAFSQRSTLVIHERYHSGARPYACSLCGRGFVARGLLSMHLKTTCV